MVEPTKAAGKVLQFAARPPSAGPQLEKWFRGVVRSNYDLVSALELMRDAYKKLLAENKFSEPDRAVLLAVEIALRNAKNARTL
jgi:hypothetical protein